MIRLGVNIDHIATLRQARKAKEPDPVQAALLAEAGGADGITIHLREDRRHIQEYDVERLRGHVKTKLNLEMAAVEEMVRIATRFSVEDACLVPEKRQELTTEGGLDLGIKSNELVGIVGALRDRGICVTAFLDPERYQIELAKRVGFDCVEIHTGPYSNATGEAKWTELARIQQAANWAHELGLEVHAGHGLDYDNIGGMLQVPWLTELNIGHSIVARSVYVGMKAATQEMKKLLAGKPGGIVF